MASTKLKVDNGPLATKRDLISGCLANVPALVNVVMAWSDAVPDFIPTDDNDPNSKQAKMRVLGITRQVKDLSAVVKCVQDFQSATYLEDGKLVTHMRLRFKDLEAGPEPPK